MKTFFTTILLLLFFSPLVSYAADISFNVDKNIVAQNEDFLVQVFVDTKDLTVNALEGTVIFSSDFLELKEIRDGNSVVNFWINKPQNTANGQVSFSGITPGGFSGAKNFLFSLVFKAKKIGSSSISFDKLQILKNDGLGTKVPIKASSLVFSIIKETKDSVAKDLTINDLNPPEIFQPFIGSDPGIFDGKYFLVFSTVDKGVGVDHYEIREGEQGSFSQASSPYELGDQTLSKKIFVKAIDKNGNVRIVTIAAEHPTVWYQSYLLLAILLLLIVVIIVKKLWPRFTK